MKVFEMEIKNPLYKPVVFSEEERKKWSELAKALLDENNELKLEIVRLKYELKNRG